MHTSGSEHESSFMMRLMRESGSSCRGIDFELAPFCARVAVEVREGCDHLGRVQCRLRRCVTACSDSRVSHKWCIFSTCLWSFGGSGVGSTLFLDVFAGSSTRWLRTVGLGARKLTNVLGSAGRRPPSSPKVGTHTRAPVGGGRSVGGAILRFCGRSSTRGLPFLARLFGIYLVRFGVFGCRESWFLVNRFPKFRCGINVQNWKK